jgi:hypothetical protein
MASFSVVSLMKETPDVIARFARHYHRIGAERIHVYVDGPLAPDLDPAALAEWGVELTACDAAFWEAEGIERPDTIQTRQSEIYQLAQRRCRSDWLFVCDADEFILDRIPVPDFLDRIPRDVISVRIPPAEAVWGPGEPVGTPFGSTWFRRPVPGRRLAARAYGPWAGLLQNGLAGYKAGKQFVRSDARFDLIHLHVSKVDGRKVSPWARQIDPALAAVEVAHYEAIGFERWRRKFARRLGDSPVAIRRRSPHRRRQQAAFRICSRLGPWALRLLFARLYRLDARQLRVLEARGLAFRTDLFGSAA